MVSIENPFLIRAALPLRPPYGAPENTSLDGNASPLTGQASA